MKKSIQNLQSYHAWLSAENKANPNSARPETPAEFKFKTLWIPVWSGNRTATFDLNHQISSLKFHDLKDQDFYLKGVPMLLGYNGNCETPYAIIEVQKEMTEQHLTTLCEMVTKACNKPESYPIYRVLKADQRMITIIECLKQLF